MKKKLVLVLIVLSVFCFTGFAQETFNFESSQYVAKAEKNEKQYTFVVSAEVRKMGKSEWVYKMERFVIISTSLEKAKNTAKNRFSKKHTDLRYDDAASEYIYLIRNFVIECEAVDNACNYDFSS